MASVTLTKPDIAMFADPTDRVRIGHMRQGSPTRAGNRTHVRFEGDEWPTAWSGEGRSLDMPFVARFVEPEHADFVAFRSLLDRAIDAPDGRLVLRLLRSPDQPDLNDLLIGTIDGWQEVHLGGLAWDVAVTFRRTVGTVEV